MKKYPIILGLTGGIASGKSTVLRSLRRCGAVTIDVDRIAREVISPGTVAAKSVARAFGKNILTQAGVIDRRKLALLIFAQPRLRRKLDTITHPAIVAALIRAIGRLKKQSHASMIAVEVPLLYEAGLLKLFDAVVVVWVPAVVQRRRLIARDSLRTADAALRIKAQMPLSRKKALADFVIANDGSRPSTALQARELFERLTRAGK